MKIIQICAAYKPAYVYGGPTMSVSKLSEELTKANLDIIVLTTTANGETELDVPIGKATWVDGVKVYYFKRWTKDHSHFSPGLYWFLYRTIKKSRQQELVVHIHAWWNLVSIFSCLIAKWMQVKVVLSPRGMLNEYTLNNSNSLAKRLLHQFLGRNLLQYCHIHATSDAEAKDISSVIPNQIKIIPNFVELGTLTVSPTKQAIFRLVFLGRINEIKGIDKLLTALSKLEIAWHLDIGGQGKTEYVEQLKAQAKNLQIAQHITWHGSIARQDKFNFLSHADLLVLPSVKENFANVVIEALSIGLPVLVSEGVGLATYVTQQQLGWVCPQEPDQIAQCLSAAFNDQAKRDRIRQQAPQILRNDFGSSALLHRYKTLYE